MGNGLGLHRPYFSKDYFQGLSPTEAKKMYDEISNDVKEYLISMDIPIHIIDKMVSHGSEDIYFLDRSYSTEPFKSNIPELKFAPFFEEWIISKCGSGWTDEEYEAYSELVVKIERTVIEEHALEALKAKMEKHSECVRKPKIESQLNIKTPSLSGKGIKNHN